MKICILESCQKIFIILYFLYSLCVAFKKECENDVNCHLNWPNSVCRRFRCVCKPDSIRRASVKAPHGWVCLSLFDVSK